MTKKDFELIARVLHAQQRAALDAKNALMNRNSSALELEACDIRWFEVKRTAHRFADELAATNPRFDRERFLTAAGVA